MPRVDRRARSIVPEHAAHVMPLTLKKHLTRVAAAAEEDAAAAAAVEEPSVTAAISTTTLPSLSDRMASRSIMAG